MLVRFLIAVLTVVALAAPRPAAADDTLTIISGGFPAAFPQVLGDVADKAGFYKAEHLIVDQQYTGGAATAAVQLVASGKGDIASVGTEPIIQGYEKGVRLMAFFSRDPLPAAGARGSRRQPDPHAGRFQGRDDRPDSRSDNQARSTPRSCWREPD